MILRTYQQDLITATRQAFYTHNRPLVVLPCGGGKTVCFAYMASEHIKKHNGYVWFLVHRGELIQQTEDTFKAFGLQTDNVLIAMVQTITRHIKQYKPPTMIIFDEAHHASAIMWQRIIAYYNSVPVIGLTATPTRLNGQPLGNVFDTLVVGVTSEWLMRNSYLCNYDYYAPKIIDYNFTVKGSDYDMEQVSNLFVKSKIYGEISRYIDLNRKTIIYCPSIAYSENIANLIKGVVHFDGNTSKKTRKQIIDDFRDGKIRVLSNVDLIGEGFDVPDCDCVMLLRPTMSTALYIQQAMRCLRPGDNKRAIIYDFVGNVYRHGMPTDDQQWTLNKPTKMRSNTAPDALVRECSKCYKVYKGTNRICPYCGYDNGKTHKEIEQDKRAELEVVRKIERKQVGMAHTLNDLIIIGKQRGYKNPVYWAKMIMQARNNRV